MSHAHATQRSYYADPAKKPGMAPGSTPVVERHLQAALAAAEVAPGARILELGCGMGRFSGLLASQGFKVTGLDLSPDLLAVAHAQGDRGINYVCGDAEQAERHVDGPFDAILGFFFLHHMKDFAPVLSSARQLLGPNGRVVFIEPNGRNPLFYLQVLLTPHMSFRGEAGLHKMRPGPLQRGFAEADLDGPQIARYGFFPPTLSNRRPGRWLESKLERLPPLKPVLPYQVIVGSRHG